MTDNNSRKSFLQERLAFMGIDGPARAELRALQPLLAKSIGPALDVFYEKVRKDPHLSAFFKDETHIAHAKSKQQQHWDSIASAEFGADYERRVNIIGQTHARLGLEPRFYIGGYSIAAEQLIHAVVAKAWPSLLSLAASKPDAMARSISVLVKAVMLDMDLAITTYLDSLEAQRQQAEASRAAAEHNQSQAMKLLADGLARLAQGDLVVRIDQDVAPDFEAVKNDFNRTVEQLQKAMLAVQDNASAITAGTSEISSAADDLSRRTEQQASSLEETAAALDEITATVRKAAEGAHHAREVVDLATEDARKGGAVVRQAVEAMSSIEKSSAQISQIIGVIDEIAFQTNLLALNAGVEAARAGEAGRGFAVVASEVRALAQRSAEAAKEIKGLISTSAGFVERGVQLVAETGSSLERIVTQVTEINGVVTSIASGAQEQATGLQQVNSAVNQMDQVTQQNAAMVEQTTAASHALMRKAEEMAAELGKFRLSQMRETMPLSSAPAKPRLRKAS